MGLNDISKEIRQTIFKAAYKSNGAHIGGSFSCVEILTSLYFDDVLQNFGSENRDRFILSKGHAAIALYATLYKKGIITKDEMFSYCIDGGTLGTHPKYKECAGIEASTGSLGHGLSVAIGMAMAAKIQNNNFNVYCLLGDGECQEGSVWEAAMFAPQQKLDNLTAIIDYNKLQAMERLSDIVELEPFTDKWKSFGWDVMRVDGHNIDDITNALKQPLKSKPKLIIADTTKGKGISYMENMPLWHFRMPNEEELNIALSVLDMAREELIVN